MKKVLVIKGPGIGDIITSIPLFRNLKKFFPDSKIYVLNTIINEKCGYYILKSCPYVNHIIRIDRNIATKNFLKIIKKVLSIRKNKFDLMINSYVNIKRMALVSALINAKYKIGYSHHPYKFLYDIAIDSNQNVVKAESSIFKKLGFNINKRDLKLELFFNLKKENKKIKQILEKYKIKNKFLVGIYAGKGSNDLRCWSSYKWANLLNYVNVHYKNTKPILIGGEVDKSKAKEIEKLLKYKIINLVGKLNLKESISLINKLNALISTNGSPIHMAAVSKIPTINLCGPSRPTWNPFNSNAIIIRKSKCKKYCNRNDQCIKNIKCIEKIEVKDVLKNFNKILK